jgi:hypothetical protein
MHEVRRLAGYGRTVFLDPWSDRRLVWSVVGVFFAVSIYRYTMVTLPNLDVSWLTIAAERMLAGGTYLDDFHEINWPLAIMIYCPGVSLSRLLGVDAYTGVLITFFLLIGGSVVTVGKLLNRLVPTMPAATGVLVVVCAWVLLFPHRNFGQREHFAIVMFLPFVIAAAGRAVGAPLVSRFAEVSIGAAAAIGIFVKPHLLLLPAAIFIVRLLRRRAWHVLWHPDFLTFVVLGFAYITMIFLFYPGWIEVAKRALQFYSAYNAEWYGLLRSGGTGLAWVLLTLIATRFVTIPSAAKSLVLHLGITAAVAAVIFVLQRKGWSYQFFPAKVALTLLVLAFATTLLAAAELSRTRLRPIYGHLSALLVLSAALMPVARDIWRDYHRLERYRNTPVTQLVRATKPGTAIFVFSVDVGDGFPMMLLEKRVWASRFPSLWLVPGIVAHLAEARTPSRRAQLQVLQQSTIEMTLSDFRRFRPAVVLVPRQINLKWLQEGFDYLTFYRTNPAFDAIWSGYRPAGRAGKFDIYVRGDL